MKNIDPATLEIMRNYFNSIVTNMGNVIERTSFSTYVRESADFATALASPEGEFYSYPTSVGVTIFLGLNLRQTLDQFSEINPGDIIITNDPYTTDGLATHLPDLNVIKPIFYNNKVVSYAWDFVNVSDVGGTVPSSLSPNLKSVFQEGLRIPPVKLYKNGELQKDVLNLIISNSRTPELNSGDIDAMVSSVNTGENLLLKMIDKFSIDTVNDGISELMNQSEKRTSSILSEIPNGTYQFEDYLSDDYESDVPIRLALDTTIDNGKIKLDFSRCDPQVNTAFNIMTNGEKNSFLLQGLINYVISTDPYIPINGGIMRPISVVMPKGTLVNPNFPAAIGIRHAIAMRMYNVILGSLIKAGLGTLPAAGAGQSAIVVLNNSSTSSEIKNNMAVVEPVGGGGGASQKDDGIDGIDNASGFLQNTPIEVLEQNMDILVHHYQYLPDTAGAGKQRGGSSISLQFEITQPDALVTARGIERMKFQPWGVNDGNAGHTGQIKIKSGNNERTLNKISVLNLYKGDLVTINSPSGGGNGNPLQRDVDLVLKDVNNELLTVDHAKQWYGVIIKEKEGKLIVDIDGTNNERSQLSQHINNHKLFDLGKFRNNYEKQWNPRISDYLAIELRNNIPYESIGRIKHLVHSNLSNQYKISKENINEILQYNK